ncbi:membrane-spanning 4-domains subfamily A member 4A-like [Engystomops pustulosus]|uniref:membrane-spanning 4-domains subfamily A member 4A-like n=1 Tax=Engystomops pustulosus TaxID=76066 RepID=UPI003AFB6CBF
MSKPEKEPPLPVNVFPAPPAAPPPTYIPPQYQWNVVPGPTGANVFAAPPPWNVTQVAPQNYPPAPGSPWNIQPAVPGQNVPNDFLPHLSGVTACHQTFVKGKPKALGIVLIVSSILQILFAISLPFLAFTVTFISGIQMWGPVFYIIAGSFSIRAQKIQSIRLVKSSYGLSIVSSIFSFTAIILNIVDFSVIDCDYYYNCHDEGSGAYTIVSILLLLNLLVFCVTVSISVFGGRALEHVPSIVPPVFVIQNMVPMPPSGYPPNPLEAPAVPPPYNS